MIIVKKRKEKQTARNGGGRKKENSTLNIVLGRIEAGPEHMPCLPTRKCPHFPSSIVCYPPKIDAAADATIVLYLLCYVVIKVLSSGASLAL